MTATNGHTTISATSANIRLIVILLTASFFGIAVFSHLFCLNSHYYETWRWRWLPSSPTYPFLIAASIPFFVGQLLYAHQKSFLPIAMIFVMISVFILMLTGSAVQQNPPSLDRIAAVQSGWDTGYFTEAKKLQGTPVRQWLAHYPQLVEGFGLHPRTKPPGLILFETMLIDWFGPERHTARIAGYLVGLVAMFSVPATYAFIKFFTQRQSAAFFGASYFALCPGPILCFPIFDQWYPIATLAVTVLWAVALQRNRLRYSAALGLVYGVTTFVTYLPGVLVVFLLGYAVLQRIGNPNCGLSRVLKHIVMSLGVFFAFYAVLWAATGFNIIATFRENLRQVDVLWNFLVKTYALRPRHLPGTIPADLCDFALGSGWISFLIAGFYFKSAIRTGLASTQTRIALLCVAQFVIVALTGQIQCETSRLWIFMLPMLMVPVGLELEKWEIGGRIITYMALLLLTIAICQSMTFLPAR